MANNPPRQQLQLGEAQSTKAAKLAAYKIYNRYQRHRNDPTLDEITFDYIEGDNLQAHLTMFCAWLGNTTISHGFDKLEDHCWAVVPEPDDKSKTVKYVKAKTKVEYAGKVMEALLQKFPNHPSWRGNKGEEGCWWTVMRAGSLKAATRNQDTNEDESTTTRPLYMENKPGYQPRASYENINSEVDRIDMDA